ncbi:hypothetical protein JYA63_07040 [Fictibacillus nanhaiensis]|uniref:Uncharacterized protein n=1 Tax=Fictibacillus nanhaiensis TaxID=742169 RepID=A0ABS2ZNB5_9BACL|nr:hypothetical protein [Fictibacillus nanhaiensis]
MVLQNLKVIRDQLKSNSWTVDAFLFTYKQQDFVVLVKLYPDTKSKQDPYAIVRLEFLKRPKMVESYSTYATLYKIHISDLKLFRAFFGIEYGENLGNILKQFTDHFATFIPDHISANNNPVLKEAVLTSLDRTDPNPGRYCIGIRRNGYKKDGSPAQRTPENNQKAALLIPELHGKIDDNSLSFRFSEDQILEKTMDEIYMQWLKR